MSQRWHNLNELTSEIDKLFIIEKKPTTPFLPSGDTIEGGIWHALVKRNQPNFL